MNKILRNLQFIALGIALLGGLLFLVYKTQAVDSSLTQQAETTLRRFEEIDTKLNLDVLRSYMGIQQNYDELAKALPVLAQTDSDFSTLVKRLGLPEIEADTLNLQAILQEKLALVERFKTQHAILRNSLYAMPKLLEELRSQLSIPQESPIDRVGGQPYKAAIGTLREDASLLMDELLALAAFSKIDSKRSVERMMVALRVPNMPYSPEVGATMESFLGNAEVILQRWEAVNTLLNQMQEGSTKITAQLHVMDDLLGNTFNNRVLSQDRWRKALVVYSSSLLLLLAFMGWRLWYSFRALDQANTSLEQRVEERTHALSTALSELKESQLQLIQSEKMASLGQMVAGVAHEINTPLAYVKGGLEILNARLNDMDALVTETSSMMRLMTEEPTEDGRSEQELAERFSSVQEITSAFVETDAVNELKGLLGDGLHGIGQISEIVSNLKDFSRLDRARFDQFNINDGITSTLKIARNIVKHRHIEQSLNDVPLIICSPSQINQVFLNLITNACQATHEDGGVVTIVTYHTPAGVGIDISDNGQGISAEDLPKIFDPFFTTKQVGEGTGLGLSIVQRIIKEHGGEIRVESTPGVGTCFSVFLPLDNANNTDQDSATTKHGDAV